MSVLYLPRGGSLQQTKRACRHSMILQTRWMMAKTKFYVEISAGITVEKMARPGKRVRLTFTHG